MAVLIPAFPSSAGCCEYPHDTCSAQWQPQEREMLWRTNPSTGQKVELQFVRALGGLRHGEGLTGRSQDITPPGSSSCPSAPPHLFFCLLSCSWFQGLLAGPAPKTTVCASNLPFPHAVFLIGFSNFSKCSMGFGNPVSRVSPSNLPARC